ncbi:hypothetical protein ALO48_200146 [Pseudomonas syringae pv. rhaphiolepidis]|nr:hypothetical protein ALO48_200146 [Pseudomonas syringae pv. rhaphiolepidis]
MPSRSCVRRSTSCSRRSFRSERSFKLFWNNAQMTDMPKVTKTKLMLLAQATKPSLKPISPMKK